MVRFQSMSEALGRRVRAALLSAPLTAWTVSERSRSSRLVGDDADDRPRRGAGPLGDDAAEPDERRDEVDVGLHGLHRLGLEERLGQPEAVHRVVLHDLHDRRREVAADVAEPPGHPWRGRPEAAAALAVVEARAVPRRV